MIYDLTQQFINKVHEFQKQNSYSQSSQVNDKNSKQGQVNSNRSGQISKNIKQKAVQNQIAIPLEYQLSLKYAKDVYMSLQKIQEILVSKKDNYFSNAAYSLSSFTNQQRNQFDEQTGQALKVVSEQIDQLKTTSDKINQSALFTSLKYGNKNLNSKRTYHLHLKQVILCLHQYFLKLQSQFGEFLKYNQLKKKKILSTLSIENQQKKHSFQQTKFFQKRQNLNQNSQLQKSNPELERQAHQFYLQKVQDQKKALQAKQAIQSINEILQQMSKKVLDQQLLTSSFQDIGSIGLKFIDQGNKNLIEANNLSKQTGKYWIFLFLGLAFSLLIVDFLKS